MSFSDKGLYCPPDRPFKFMADSLSAKKLWMFADEKHIVNRISIPHNRDHPEFVQRPEFERRALAFLHHL